MKAKQKYVVLGSNCFTGTHIVDRLLTSTDGEVFAFSRSSEKSDLYSPYQSHLRPGFKFMQLNLATESDRLIKILDEIQPDYVINVAALSEVYQSNLTPNEYFDINTSAVVRLANALRTRKWLKRYVHISSAEIYGKCTDAIFEDAPLNPSTPYAVSKAAADMYLLTIARNFGFPVTLIRSTNVYGKHQQLFKIIPRNIIYLKLGKVIELHGGGHAIKSFIHIRDVVDGVFRVLQHPNPDTIYHFSTSNSMSIADIVKMICSKMNYNYETSARVVGERLGQDSRYWLDCSKAKRDLGWEPRVDFESGVNEMIEWVEKNGSRIQKEPLEYIHVV